MKHGAGATMDWMEGTRMAPRLPWKDLLRGSLRRPREKDPQTRLGRHASTPQEFDDSYFNIAEGPQGPEDPRFSRQAKQREKFAARVRYERTMK